MNRQVASSKTCFFLIDGVERPIEVVEGLQLAEHRGLDPPLELAIGSYRQLVLEHQFQELDMAQAVARRLLEPDLQAGESTRES